MYLQGNKILQNGIFGIVYRLHMSHWEWYRCNVLTVKIWLAKQFDIEDLRETNYMLRIQIIRDRKNRFIALSQASYIDKILTRFYVQDFKKGFLPFQRGVELFKE